MSSIYLNEVRVIGNVGAEPVLRKTDGLSVLNLSVATTHKTAKHERTDWHRVVLWGVLAEHASRNIRTGSSIMVGGRLRNSKWTDEAGVERFSTEIVGETMQIISGWKIERAQEEAGASSVPPAKQTESYSDDAIPF